MNLPEGWPTEEMITAGFTAYHFHIMNSPALDSRKAFAEAFAAALAVAPTPTAQEHEPVYQVRSLGSLNWRDTLKQGYDAYGEYAGYERRILYTRPADDKLRKAAEEVLAILREEEEICKGWARDQNIKIQRVLSAALEGK